MLGATDAAGSKVFFQTTVKDADYSAAEFAKEASAEVRLEEQYGISQEPVGELMRRGHAHPDIREFVNRHIRPMQEQLEDTRDEIEGERLIRTDLLDQAALARLDERMDWLTLGRRGEAILGQAGSAVAHARSQTAKMQSLLAASRGVRSSLRAINKFLTAIMEGRTGRGLEDFSEFLITRVRDSGLVPANLEGLIELYISLLYGDPGKSHAVPYDLARSHQLFGQERLSVDLMTSGKTEAARRDLEKSYPRKEWE